jgi:hypothetical protein
VPGSEEHQQHRVVFERDGGGEAGDVHAAGQRRDADEGLDGEAQHAVVLDVVGEAEGVRAAELRALSRQQRSLRENGVEVQHLEHHRGLVGQVARASEDVEQVAADAVGLYALEAVREGEVKRGRSWRTTTGSAEALTAARSAARVSAGRRKGRGCLSGRGSG